MTSRDYKLTTFNANNGRVENKTFTTLENCIWYLCERLSVLNSLELLDVGHFVITEFKKHKYHKAYVVTVYVPFTRFYVKKISTGSWNETEVLDTIKLVKELYNERI